MGVHDWLRGRRAESAAEMGEAPASDEAAIVAGSRTFATALYRELATKPDGLFFSPSSITAALAMTAAGARGETAEELATALSLPLPPGRLHPALGRLLEATSGATDIELATANALWLQAGYALRAEYLALVRETYRAALEEVDFVGAGEEARARINAWVEKRTKGRIRDLVPPGVLDALARLVLVNAIYFKGSWSVPFRRQATRDEPFHRLDGSSVRAPLMQRTGSYRLVADHGAQAIELPYGDGAIAWSWSCRASATACWRWRRGSMARGSVGYSPSSTRRIPGRSRCTCRAFGWRRASGWTMSSRGSARDARSTGSRPTSRG
jgi:serpin B